MVFLAIEEEKPIHMDIRMSTSLVESKVIYISNPLLLAKQHNGEQFLLYLVVTELVVVVILVRMEKGTQCPIYYVSNTLGNAETQY